MTREATVDPRVFIRESFKKNFGVLLKFLRKVVDLD